MRLYVYVGGVSFQWMILLIKVKLKFYYQFINNIEKDMRNCPQFQPTAIMFWQSFHFSLGPK